MKMEGAADMKTEELRKIWKAEEALAHIHGWDFSHIDSRHRGRRIPALTGPSILQNQRHRGISSQCRAVPEASGAPGN